MSRERIEGHWKHAKAHVKEQWERLADGTLHGKLKGKHAPAEREAEREVKDWEVRNLRLFEKRVQV